MQDQKTIPPRPLFNSVLVPGVKAQCQNVSAPLATLPPTRSPTVDPDAFPTFPSEIGYHHHHLSSGLLTPLKHHTTAQPNADSLTAEEEHHAPTLEGESKATHHDVESTVNSERQRVNRRCWFVANLPMSMSNQRLEHELFHLLPKAVALKSMARNNAAWLKAATALEVDNVTAMRDNQGRPIAFVHFRTDAPDPRTLTIVPVLEGRQLRIEFAHSPNAVISHVNDDDYGSGSYRESPPTPPMLLSYPTPLWLHVTPVAEYERRWLRGQFRDVFQLCAQFGPIVGVHSWIDPEEQQQSASSSLPSSHSIHHRHHNWIQVTFVGADGAFQCLECVQRFPPVGLTFHVRPPPSLLYNGRPQT
jgi:hypothetical protein